MKSFKNIFGLFLTIGLISACNPLQDDVDEIIKNDPLKKQVSFTMTEDDYDAIEGLAAEADSTEAENIANRQNFGSDELVRKYIPLVLADKYPQFGEGSTALVFFDLYRGAAPAVSNFTSIAGPNSAYQVTAVDYSSLGGDAATYNLFTANQPPQDLIPVLLSDSIENPAEGDRKLVLYDYVDEVVDPSVSFTMSTDEYQALVDYVEEEKGAEWINTYGDLDYYYGSGAFYRNFEGRASTHKNWIADNSLMDNLFDGSTDATTDSLRVEGRIQEGIVQLLKLNYPSATPSVNGTDKFYFVDYAVYYGGGLTVNYTVQYQATGVAASLDFELIAGPSTDGIGSSSASESKGDYYVYNGDSWELEEGVYYLSSADYDAMGEPGRFNNFSSSSPAANYLPALLDQKYPFAQEEEEFTVIYKYYSSSAGSTQTRGDLLTYLNGSWSIYQSVTEESLQFGVEDGVWVPDNTISYTFTGEDFDAIAANDAIGSADARANLAQYGNFNLNSWSDDDILDAINFILKEKYASDSVEGQKFVVSYDTYPLGLQSKAVIFEGGNYILQ